MEAEPLLCQAEILYLSLRELIASEDRRTAYMDSNYRPPYAGCDNQVEEPCHTVVDSTLREMVQ